MSQQIINIESENEPWHENTLVPTFADLATTLRFIASYSSGTPSPFSPEALLRICKDRMNGAGNTDIASLYGAGTCSIINATARADRAIAILNPDTAQLSEPDTRIARIKNGLETLPQFIEKHIRKKTPTGRLLIMHPGIRLLLSHLSKGHSIEDFIGGIPEERGQWWLHPIRQSVLNACLGSEPPSNNPNILVQIHLFTNYLRSHVNVYGRELGPKQYELICQIMDPKRGGLGVTGQIAKEFSRIRSFFRLCTLLDYYYTTNPKRPNDDYLNLHFPEIKNNEPLSVNFSKYYQTQFEAGLIPTGVRMVLNAIIEGNVNSIINTLQNHTRYQHGTIEQVISSGAYFLQSLLSHNNSLKGHSFDLGRLARNPKQDTRNIFMQIYYERSEHQS